MSKRALLASALCFAPLPVWGEPNVLTDIPPVQSVLANLLADMPHALADGGADPHHFALRPSDVRRLNDADLVVWIGRDLTPWLDDALSAMETPPAQLELLTLARKDGTSHDHDHDEEHGHDHDHDEEHGHDHDHDEEHGHDHGHDEEHGHDHGHDEEHGHDHGHDEEHGHDHGHDEEHGHDHGHDDEHGHDHGHGDEHGHDHDHAADAHLWFDVTAVQAWMDPLVTALSEADPDNAALFSERAEGYLSELQSLDAEIREILAPHQGAALVVLHDAYDPFAEAYGLTIAAALREGDHSAASASRLRDAEAAIAAQGATCIFAEPNHDAALAENLADDLGLRLAELDPLGTNQEAGPDHYAATMRAMAQSVADCLSAADAAE